MIDLKALSVKATAQFIEGLKIPSFRARQLLHWIYEKHAASAGDITEFSKDLRDRLSSEAFISNLEIIDRVVSKDGAEKFLFRLSDGNLIESVLMPEEKRNTLCISTQVGCAMNCRFCKTGSLGLKRNLKAHEIVDQVIAVKRLSKAINNIVLMGMGEPLANLEEVVESLNRLVSLIKISPRRITLSTVGLPKQLLQLPAYAPSVNIAVSLNAPTDHIRNQIMPVNKVHPIVELIDALRRYPLKRGRRITFEYVLLKGINDSEEDAAALIRLITGIPCKINIIPFNPFEGCSFERTEEQKMLSFQQVIANRGLSVFIRRSRGQDISAACGQLASGAR